MNYLDNRIKQYKKEYFELGLKLRSLEMTMRNINLEKKPESEKIIYFLDEVYNEKKVNFMSKNRKQNNVIVRNIVMYLLHNTFKNIVSLKEIGNFVGGKDHSTILHAVKVARDLRSNGDSLYETYNDIIEPIFNNHFLNLNK